MVTRHFGAANEHSFPGLNAVAAVAPDDIWLVGAVAAGPLAEHCNGHELQEMPIPYAHFKARDDAQNDSSLNGVAALSPTDVWAVGFGIEHWNGQTFTVSHVMTSDDLFGIAALSRTDLWAVGSDAANRPLVLHYSCA